MDNSTLFKYINNFCEALACGCAFVASQRSKNSYYKWFFFYLLLIFLGEMLGNHYYSLRESFMNKILYNYFLIPIQFLFFFVFFFFEFDKQLYKKITLFVIMSYIVTFILESFILKIPEAYFPFNSLSYTIANVFLLTIVMTYFIELAKSDKVLHFTTNFVFWVSLGILIFYLGSLPYYGLFNFLYKNYYKTIMLPYWYVQISLSALTYICFSIGFIWSKPN